MTSHTYIQSLTAKKMQSKSLIATELHPEKFIARKRIIKAFQPLYGFLYQQYHKLLPATVLGLSGSISSLAQDFYAKHQTTAPQRLTYSYECPVKDMINCSSKLL